MPELAEIYTARSLGSFLELISFPPRSVPFDLLSKVEYTKMVLVSCGHGSRKIARRNLYHALFRMFSAANYFSGALRNL